MTKTNEFGQPIGDDLPVGWREPIIPKREPMLGQYTRVEPLRIADHAQDYLLQINTIRPEKTGLIWGMVHSKVLLITSLG